MSFLAGTPRRHLNLIRWIIGRVRDPARPYPPIPAVVLRETLHSRGPGGSGALTEPTSATGPALALPSGLLVSFPVQPPPAFGAKSLLSFRVDVPANGNAGLRPERLPPIASIADNPNSNHQSVHRAGEGSAAMPFSGVISIGC
jgi:hypothetical protein